MKDTTMILDTIQDYSDVLFGIAAGASSMIANTTQNSAAFFAALLPIVPLIFKVISRGIKLRNNSSDVEELRNQMISDVLWHTCKEMDQEKRAFLSDCFQRIQYEGNLNDAFHKKINFLLSQNDRYTPADFQGVIDIFIRKYNEIVCMPKYQQVFNHAQLKRISSIESILAPQIAYFHDVHPFQPIIVGTIAGRNSQYSRYLQHEEELYFNNEDVDKYIDSLLNFHGVILWGRQASGKTTLAIKIAVTMQNRGMIDEAYYLPAINNLDVERTIRRLRLGIGLEKRILWIIDNLQMRPEYFSVLLNGDWYSHDYFMLLSRIIPDKSSEYQLLNEQSFHITVKIEDISNILLCQKNERILTRKQEKRLFDFCAGDLVILDYILKMNVPLEAINIGNICKIAFDHFFNGMVLNDQLRNGLQMLTLLQYGIPIDDYLIQQAGYEILREHCILDEDNSLFIEHVSIASLLFSALCYHAHLDYVQTLQRGLEDTLKLFSEGRDAWDPITCEKFRSMIIYFNANKPSLESIGVIIPNDALLSLPCVINVLQDHKELDTTDFLSDLISIYSSMGLRYENLIHTILQFDRLISTILKDGNIINYYKLLGAVSIEQRSGLLDILEEKTINMLYTRTIDSRNDLRAWGSAMRKLKKKDSNTLLRLEQAFSLQVYEHVIINNGDILNYLHLLNSSFNERQAALVNWLLTYPGNVNKLVQAVIDEKHSIGTLCLQLRELKNNNIGVLQTFEAAVGVEQYARMILNNGSLKTLAEILQYSSSERQTALAKWLQDNPDNVDKLVQAVIDKEQSIGTFNLHLRELKNNNSEALQAFEAAVGVEQYTRMILNNGSLMTLAQILQNSSSEMQTALAKWLQDNPDNVDKLVQEVIDKEQSIGTFNLHLRELKNNNSEALQAFEAAVGVEQYTRMILNNGSLMTLAQILQNSSSEMQTALAKWLQDNPDNVDKLVQEVIDKEQSIGTFNLHLRELKNNNSEALQAFEAAVGMEQYARMILNNGSLMTLAQILQNSSSEMQTALAKWLQDNPDNVDKLVQAVIDKEQSIGTFNLHLRELKNNNGEALQAFETAVGMEQYARMILNNGSLMTLAQILQNSSSEMQTALAKWLQDNPDNVDKLVQAVIDKEQSIGTFNLHLRELKNNNSEALQAFEAAVGVEQYARMILNNGSLMTLAQILQNSSSEMQTALVKWLHDNPDNVDKLVQTVIDKEQSIGTFCLQLRELKNNNSEALQAFEAAVGMEQYARMILNNGSLMTLAQILQNSSSEMQTALVKWLHDNPDNVDKLVQTVIDKEQSIGTFCLQLRELKNNNSEALQAFEAAVGMEQYARMLLSNGSLKTLVEILQHSSSERQTALVKWLQDNPDNVDKLVQAVIDMKQSVDTFDLQLRELKNKDGEALQVFEDAIGVEHYIRMILNSGSIKTMLNFLANSSPERQNLLVKWLQNNPKNVDKLIQAVIDGEQSIDTFGLKLRELKNNNSEALQAFEDAIGVEHYIRMILNNGSIVTLLKFLENSSPERQNLLAKWLQNNPKNVDKLIQAVIDGEQSIDTFGLKLRELKNNNSEALQAFEDAIGVEHYIRMILNNGSIVTLLNFLSNSSPERQNLLAKWLQNNPKNVDKLIQAVIEREQSINTFGLKLRELKNNNSEALQAFEDAIGVEQYASLILKRGSIIVLAQIIMHSSSERQTAFAKWMQSHPENVTTLIQSAISSKESLGTFNMSLRDIKKSNLDVFTTLVDIFDINDFGILIAEKGDLTILYQILYVSTQMFRSSLLVWFRSELNRLEKLLNKSTSLGSLSLSMRQLKYCGNILEDFERNISIGGYQLVLELSDSPYPLALRFIAESTKSDAISTWLLEQHPNLVDKMKSNCSKIDEGLMAWFPDMLFEAQYTSACKVYELMFQTVSPADWLTWCKYGATLDEFIIILYLIHQQHLHEIERICQTEDGKLLLQKMHSNIFKRKTSCPVKKEYLMLSRAYLLEREPSFLALIDRIASCPVTSE